MQAPIIRLRLKSFALLFMSTMLLVQVFSVFLPVSSVGATDRPTDDAGELYDQVIKYQTVAALGNCMNRQDQDNGENTIGGEDAVNGRWFKDNFQIFVGSLVGKKRYCNDIVKQVAQYADTTNIGLLCMFVPITKEGNRCEAENESTMKDSKFYPLDFEVYGVDGSQQESRGYSQAYYDEVVVKKLGMNADWLSGQAKYYMYLNAFLNSAFCRAEPGHTESDGWEHASIGGQIEERFITYDPRTGPQESSGWGYREYHYKEDNYSEDSFWFQGATTEALKNVIAVTGMIGWGPRSAENPVGRIVIGKETWDETNDPDAKDERGNPIPNATKRVIVVATGTHYFYEGEKFYDGTKFLDAGIWGADDLMDDHDYKVFNAEFMDCQAMVDAVNANFASYTTWAKSKNISLGGMFDSGVEPNCDNSGDSDCEELTTSCAIPSVGWIVCPVMNFLGSVTDGMYGIISSFLEVRSSLIDTSSGTYNGWSTMRNLANVVLVVVFLIIIFSQLTSLGINNYGIKKMLPRLVVAAILINVSFFVTQIAVDVSNILGSSLQGLMSDMPVYSNNEDGSFWTDGGGNGSLSSTIGDILAGGTLSIAGIATVVLAGAGVAYFGGVGLLLMVVLSGMLAVAITFLILAARMALVVVLVVIAPLAFAAMVLPNTKDLYDKWQKMFVGVLVVFPMIAVVYGGAQLASNIIIQNAGHLEDFPSNLMLFILGIGVALVPLFATIPILKGSLNAVPAIGKFAQSAARFNPLRGGVRKGLSGAAAAAGSHARLSALRGDFGRVGQRFARGRAMRQQRNAGWAGDIQREEASAVSSAVIDSPNASTRDKASAYSTLDKLEKEDVDNAVALLKRGPVDGHINNAKTQLGQAIASGDRVKAAAATRVLASTAPGRAELETTLLGNNSSISGANYDSPVSASIRSELLSSGIKSSNNALNTFAYSGNGADLESIVKANTVASLTDAEVASQDIGVLKRALEAGHIDSGQASRILDNSSISNGISIEKRTAFEAAKVSGGASFTVSHSNPSSGTSTGGSTGFNVN